MPDPDKKKAKIAVIVVAAGRGRRAGEGGPKQYRKLMGKPVIVRTLEAFLSAFAEISPKVLMLPVIHADDRDLYLNAVDGVPGIEVPVIGGATRQHSVRNALEHLSENLPDYVLIHDAARPFVPEEVIKTVLMAVTKERGGVVPALPIVDSLVRKPASSGYDSVVRDDLLAVQTPQAFPFADILAAHRAAEHDDYTDDASVFVANGGDVSLVEGSAKNFKITTTSDFHKAEQTISSLYTDIRVGSGYDVHRFENGTTVWLGGIEIPFSKQLKGHSDADVALHALTDAVLSSIADGDIGTHFPPTDDKWRGVSSDKFLSFACDRVRVHGGKINHLTVIIICEAPKIGPHVDIMRRRIAEIAGIGVSRVSVQATTTEKLGFTGRGEGIAAQATATVSLPSAGAGL